MKSSTIRRSTLSRETMEVIENLAKEQELENGLGEYVRPEEITPLQNSEESSKAQEIDLLWQNFKSTQFNTNSPTAYILLGFIIGVISTLLLLAGINMFVIKSGAGVEVSNKRLFKLENLFGGTKVQDPTLEQQANSAQDEVENKVSVPTEEDNLAPADVVDNNSTDSVEQNQLPEENSTAETNFDKSKMKKYIVKSGDTGESIIKHYFGTYSPEKADLIMKANNLKNLDRINIDQVLYIPVE